MFLGLAEFPDELDLLDLVETDEEPWLFLLMVSVFIFKQSVIGSEQCLEMFGIGIIYTLFYWTL